MIICLCEGISDRTIRSAIRKGCGSVRALRDSTRAATDCANCACDLKRMLREDHDNAARCGGGGTQGGLLR